MREEGGVTSNISNLKNFGIVDSRAYVPHGLHVNASAPSSAVTVRLLADSLSPRASHATSRISKRNAHLTSAGSCASPLPFQCSLARARCCCMAASNPSMSTPQPACFATRHVKSAGKPNESYLQKSRVKLETKPEKRIVLKHEQLERVCPADDASSTVPCHVSNKLQTLHTIQNQNQSAVSIRAMNRNSSPRSPVPACAGTHPPPQTSPLPPQTRAHGYRDRRRLQAAT